MKHFFYKFVLFSALFLTGCLETPQADAGSNQTVNSGQKVILDGSGSVGELLLYHWEQTKGTSVILDGVDTDKATFVAPTIDEKEMLVFTLTVQEEGKKEKSTDSVSIIIEPNTVDHPLSIAQQFTNLFERGDKNKFGYNTTAYLDDKEKRGLTVGIIFTTGTNAKDFCKFSDAYDVIKKYAEMVEDVNAETFAFKEVVNSCDKSDFDNIDFADINKTWHDLNDSLFYRAQDAIFKKTTYTPALDASKKLKGSLLTVLNLQNAYVLHGHGEDENSTDGMIGIASADDAFYEFEGEDDEKEWLGRFLNARWVEFCGDDEHRKALSILSTLEKLVDEYDKYHDLENNFMDRVEQLRNHYEEIYADENNVLEKCRRYQSSDDSRYLYQNKDFSQ